MSDPTAIPTQTEAAASRDKLAPAAEVLPTAEPPADLSPAERQARAEAGLRDTQQRIEALDQRLLSIATAREALATELDAARADAEQLGRDLAAMPALVASCRARLIAYGGSHSTTEAAAQSALEAALARQQALETQEAAASEHLGRTATHAASELARLDGEQRSAALERADLALLVPHLHREARDAYNDAGRALLADLEAERVVAAEGIAAAAARMAEARAAHDALLARAALALQTYPDVLAQARGSDLVPRSAGPAERLLLAYDALLTAVEAEAGTGDPTLADGHRGVSAELGAWSVLQYSAALNNRDAHSHVATRRRHIQYLIAREQQSRQA